MWSNLIRTVFLVLSVYGECLFRVYLTLWQTDARNNYPVFCCCELGIKNRTHNFLTWTGENIRNFSWQDTSARQHKLIFFLLLFPLYSSLFRFTPERKKQLLQSTIYRLKEKPTFFVSLFATPSFRPQMKDSKIKNNHFNYSKGHQWQRDNWAKPPIPSFWEHTCGQALLSTVRISQKVNTESGKCEQALYRKSNENTYLFIKLVTTWKINNKNPLESDPFSSLMLFAWTKEVL